MRIQQLFWGTLVGSVMMSSGFCQSGVLASKIDDSKQSSSNRIRYHDQRERTTAALTFEWEFEYIYKFSKSYLERHTEASPQSTLEMAVGTADDSAHLSLQGVLRVARLPKITHIQRSQEIPYLASGAARKAEERFKADYYYLGETGEITLYVSRRTNDTIRAASIVAAGPNGFGLRPPFPSLSLGELVFLVGISPLRLMDAKTTDWKLREVNENEWIFELQPDDAMKTRMPWLKGTEKVTVHLNRQKGDAPAKVEITQGNITETWRTLAYKQVQGVWMPEQVLLEYRSSSFEVQSLYQLKEVSRTATVVLNIPRGTPVQDWRWRKRAPWTEGLGSLTVSLNRPNTNLSDLHTLEWSPELESSLWQEVRRYQGDNTP